jgi:nucleotide-binding universal stress UspA family protein
MAVLAERPRPRPHVSVGYRRILVPVVDNPESAEAVDVACRLAAEKHGSLTVVTIVEVPPQLPLDAHMLEEEQDAHALLARAQAIGESYGVDVRPCVLRARDAAEAIVSHAARTGAEIVVVGGPRRTGGLARGAPFRGTIRDVLKKAPCRVLVIASQAPVGSRAGSRPPAR